MRSRKWAAVPLMRCLAITKPLDLLYGAMQGVELAAKENASSAGVRQTPSPKRRQVKREPIALNLDKCQNSVALPASGHYNNGLGAGTSRTSRRPWPKGRGRRNERSSRIADDLMIVAHPRF